MTEFTTRSSSRAYTKAVTGNQSRCFNTVLQYQFSWKWFYQGDQRLARNKLFLKRNHSGLSAKSLIVFVISIVRHQKSCVEPCSVCTAMRHARKNLKHLFSSCLCASTNLQDQVETVTYSRSIQQELHLREQNSSYGRGKSDNSEDAVSLCGNKNVFHSIWDVI